MHSEEMFEEWISFMYKVAPYRVINTILIILLCTRTAVELAQVHPAFGTIFLTLSKAKFELLNFAIVIWEVTD